MNDSIPPPPEQILVGVEAASSVPPPIDGNFIFWHQADLEDKNLDYFYVLTHMGGKVFIDGGPMDNISPFYLEEIRKGNCTLVIDYKNEGDLGTIYEHTIQDHLYWIQSWIDRHNLPSDSVYIIHGNLKINDSIKERGLSFNGIPYITWDGVGNWDSLDKPIIEYKPNNSKNLFLSYTRRPHQHRQHFVNEAFKKGIIERGLVSMPVLPDSLHLEKGFLNMLPLVLDNPTNDNKVNLDESSIQHHEKTFISVVLESSTVDGIVFLSEKIFKPLQLGHPFMVLGNKHTLKYLKTLGYKTFSKWVDESYDGMDSWEDRSKHIVSELKRFSKMNKKLLKNIREDMEEVLAFNKDIYRENINTQNSTSGDYSWLYLILDKIRKSKKQLI